jgi:hypothetical protein
MRGVGIVGATVAGLDGTGEIAAHRSVAGADLHNRGLDRLGHHQPCPLAVRSGLPDSSAQPYRRADLIAKEFQLGAEARCPRRVVELRSFRQFRAQLADAGAILPAGLGVEQRAGIAEIYGGSARLDRCTSVTVAVPPAASS